MTLLLIYDSINTILLERNEEEFVNFFGIGFLLKIAILICEILKVAHDALGRKLDARTFGFLDDAFKHSESIHENITFIGREINGFLLYDTHSLYFLSVPCPLEHLNYSIDDSICKVKNMLSADGKIRR